MSLSQRQKGKRGERDAAAYLTSLGFPARRGRQYAGTPESPDVLAQGLEGVHIEVKFRATASLDNGLAKWCDEAETEAEGRPWAVLWRGNRQPWRLTCEVIPSCEAFHFPPVRGTFVGDTDIKAMLCRLAVFADSAHLPEPENPA